MAQPYDLITVGSSFASAFFLKGWLAKAPASARVLVLERGERHDHAWHTQNRGKVTQLGRKTYANPARKEKRWIYAPAFGGTSNIWFGNTPRPLEEDFELASRYGVGLDWPIRYADLEPYLCEAEEVIQVAGPERTLSPRSRPYPQAAHELSSVDRDLVELYPETFVACPTARASRRVEGGRPKCCANTVCNNCPIDAKFTVLNGLASVFADPRVEIRFGRQVLAVEHTDGRAHGVRHQGDGGEATDEAALVALGANAIFNPHILLQSHLDDDVVGRYLHEQVGENFRVLLSERANHPGSTSVTGHLWEFARGDRRSEKAAMLIETWSGPFVRMEAGKWLNTLNATAVLEDIPQAQNRVLLDPARPERPRIEWHGHSEYAQRALDTLKTDLQQTFEPLGVDRIVLRGLRKTEGHILGTARMGDDPKTSVVDRNLVHHRVRNLIVLGGSSFPTGFVANPSLPISALSLWAADRWWAEGAARAD